MALRKKADAQQGEDEKMPGFSDEEGGEGSAVEVNLADTPDTVEYEVLPKGVYPATVSSVEYGTSQNGNNMWTWRLSISEGAFEGRTLFYHTVFNDGGLPRVKRALKIVAPELVATSFKPDIVADDGVLEGRACRIKVDVRRYQGKPRNNVTDMIPMGEGGGSAFLDS